MADHYDLVVRVDGTAADEKEDLADLARRLLDELLHLEVDAVEPLTAPAPDGAKGVSAVAGTLGVRLGAAGLTATIAKIRGWVSRNDRSVEVTIDGDTIKVTGITAEQQDQLINVWLSRHAPRL